MKRCPTCQKEFADSMRFCQTDGTPLVEEAADPFKTMVGSKEDIASAIPPAAPAAPPVDPFKTMIGGAFAKPDESGDLLQLPEEESPDQMKTMISQGNPGIFESKFDEKKEKVEQPVSPSPFEDSAPKSASTDFGSIPPPKMPVFSEPDLNPPSIDNSPPNSATLIKDYSTEQNSPKIDSSPFSNESAENQSPFDKPHQPPSAIPSPFDLSMPPGYLPPSMSPFEELQKASAPPTKEPEPPSFTFNEPPQQTPFNQNPFDQPQQNPFGNQQMQPTEWTPPPAPESSWQSQDIGQNTPFAPPVAGQGQNQTMAIVSLVLGLLSIPCCGFVVFGIAALVTGFLAKKKADENPSEYGGRGLALAGMIVGGITTVIGLILLVLQILFGVLTNIR